MRALKKYIAVLIILLSVLVILFSPVLFQKKVFLPTDQLNTMILPYSYGKTVSVYNHFLNDAITQYYIYKSLTKAAFERGRLSYWNTFILGGYPQYALTMAGNFDILNIFLRLVKAVPWAYVLQMLCTFFVAGASMYLLLSYYGHSFGVAVIVSVAYMLNSMFITTCFHRWILASFCWMPLILLFLDKSISYRRVIDFVWCALFLGIAFMGTSIQTASFILIGIVLYAGTFWWVRGMGLKNLFGITKILVVVGLFGFGVSMVMWMPTYELFSIDSFQTNRSWFHLGAGVDTFRQRLLGIPLLFSFAIPELVGNLRAYDLTKLANATMIHYNGYIGFLPLLFGIMAMFTRKVKKMPSYAMGIILACCGVLLPIATPLLRYFYHRFFIVYILGMCIVAACGMTAYVRSENRKIFLVPLRWVTGVWILILCCLACAHVLMRVFYRQILFHMQAFIESHLYMANLIAGNRDWYMNRVYALFKHFDLFSPSMILPIAGVSLSLIVVYLHIYKKISSRFLITCAFVITSAQVIIFARNWLPMSDAEKYPLYPATEATDFLKKDKDLFRVKIYPTDPDAHPIFSSNILAMYGIETINGYESVEPPTVNWLVNGIDPKVLGAANVKYVIAHKKNNLPRTYLESVYQGSGIEIFKNSLFLPRAFMVFAYDVVPEKQSLAMIRSGAVDIRKRVFFGKEPMVQIASARATDLPKYALNITEYSPEYICMTADTDTEGYVVLSNTFYPGWTCVMDGKEVPIFKANVTMGSVYVPRGAHTFFFSFTPRVFIRGLTFSSCTLLIMLFILLRHFIKRRHEATIS